VRHLVGVVEILWVRLAALALTEPERVVTG
jgi:hypothetical protein